MTEITSRLSTALADRYKIERHIGEGGMATVYLAEDLKHGRQVAIKVLKPELAAVLGAERFVQEIKTTASLQHPNILPLFDSGTAGQRDGGTAFLYYVMPFIDGETLRQKLDREKQLGIEEAVKIATEVAEALHYAHGEGVIHGDIKPENILIHNGRPMVADFGIALAVSAAAGGRMTETGLSLGTPHYMSPEQATAEKDLTARSDIYSLGSVLYEMLTGEPPHSGGSAQQIIMKIVTEEPAPVTKVRKTVPPNVAAAVSKAMEKLAADRFGSAKAFAEALANQAFRGPATGHTATVPDSSDWRLRYAIPLTVIAAAAIVMAAIGWFRPSGPVNSSVTRLPLALNDPPRHTNDFGPTVAISPDGSKMAYLGPDRIWWVRSFGELTATPIPESEGAQRVAFSPDGDVIAYRRGHFVGQVAIRTLVGDRLEIVADSASSSFHWGRDGWMYFRTLDRSLVRVPESGGDREQLTQIDSLAGEVSHYMPSLLPGGKGLLFTIDYETDGSDKIAVLDLATKSRRTLTRGLFAQYVPSGHILVVRTDGTLMAAPFDERSLKITGTAVEVITGISVLTGLRVEMSISETGSLLYVTQATRVPDVFAWVTREGAIESIDSSWGGRLEDPRLSPDGSRLAATIIRPPANIWMKDLRTGSLTPVTHGRVIDVNPRWYGSGSGITYAAPRPPTRLTWDLYDVNVEGGVDSLILDRSNEIREGFWSPDGEWLVFQEQVAGRGDLLAVRREAMDTPIVLTAERAFEEAQAELSRDGRWLAYQSNRSGRWEIYVRPFPDAGTSWTQVSIQGGEEPVWANDGQELFYVNAAEELMVAEVTPDSTFTVRNRRALFSVADYRWIDGYDVTLDDQRFILIRGQEEAPGDVVLVQNFLEELKAKVGN